MTAVTKIEAAIQRFPFLKKHIQYWMEDGCFSIEFFPYKTSVFLAKKLISYVYQWPKDFIAETKENQSLEELLLNNFDERTDRLWFIVRTNGVNLEVYVPPFVSFDGGTRGIMIKMLQEERQKAKDDLEKKIAGLYKKVEQPTGNPGVDMTASLEQEKKWQEENTHISCHDG
jgi:hypothetical protein